MEVFIFSEQVFKILLLMPFNRWGLQIPAINVDIWFCVDQIGTQGRGLIIGDSRSISVIDGKHGMRKSQLF